MGENQSSSYELPPSHERYARIQRALSTVDHAMLTGGKDMQQVQVETLHELGDAEAASQLLGWYGQRLDGTPAAEAAPAPQAAPGYAEAAVDVPMTPIIRFAPGVRNA